MRLGLHVAQNLVEGVLHRRLHGPGGRIVPGGYLQPAEIALPCLIQWNDRAGHGGLTGLNTRSATFGALGSLDPGLTACLSSLAPADLGMGRPAGERLRRRRKVDRHHLSGSQVHRGSRPQLGPVRQVHLHPDVGQDGVCGVLHGADEGVALCIVVQDQARTGADHVEGLIRRQLIGPAALFAACSGSLASAFGPGLATATMLAAGLTAAGLWDLLSYPGLAGLLTLFPSGASGAGNQYRGQENRTYDGRYQYRLVHQFLENHPITSHL